MPSRMIPVYVDGVELLVEATLAAGSEPTSPRQDRVMNELSAAFDRAQTAIVAVAASAADTMNQLSQRPLCPDRMQIRFGLKFSLQGNVIISGIAGESTLEVTLNYPILPTDTGGDVT